jgi:hypothetical protein
MTLQLTVGEACSDLALDEEAPSVITEDSAIREPPPLSLFLRGLLLSGKTLFEEL